jgi:hypothetical protein
LPNHEALRYASCLMINPFFSTTGVSHILGVQYNSLIFRWFVINQFITLILIS